MIELIKVESTNIDAIGYIAASETLYLRFKRKGEGDGPVYLYDGVPREKYEGLMASPSKGSYFATQIKGHYQATKEDAPPLPRP